MRLKYLLKSVIFMPVVLALSFGLVYAEDKTPFTGEINAKDINLRTDATTSSVVIATLKKGEQVEVVLESYDWYKVRLPKKVSVYIKMNLASCIKSTEVLPLTRGVEPQVSRCLSAKVSGDRVNVRLKPDESGSIVGIADKGEVVNVISETDNWYKIEPIQNSFGWVHKRFVNKVVPVVVDKKTQETHELLSRVTTPDNPEKLAVFTGEVRPYGMVFLRKATHKLLTSEGKIFLLKGNRVSLNALNYKKVKVVGKIISSPEAKNPIIEIKIIEVVN